MTAEVGSTFCAFHEMQEEAPDDTGLAVRMGAPFGGNVGAEVKRHIDWSRRNAAEAARRGGKWFAVLERLTHHDDGAFDVPDGEDPIKYAHNLRNLLISRRQTWEYRWSVNVIGRKVIVVRQERMSEARSDGKKPGAWRLMPRLLRPTTQGEGE